ncbi:kynurenine/alpha-aminoadipate aminotransferase, mitochondrial-like [Dreissena polymorpha]|uniref:kynurenine/alpha-aminoadipate aminotransferase, mitochondrial-like n=1 Tax=Dreissena polymorpha TaxID=45954 RepID=UPI0022655E98|nr:kynurenine/alpha-aminoadipate aminotransferase, mitochondrial-like [Dreissena polymorpha]
MKMNYMRFLNKVSLGRKPSPIRVLTAILQQSPPSMISMAGGMPNVGTFPVESASFKLRDGTHLEMNPTLMKQALQYCPTPGMPGLVEWLKTLQERKHNQHGLLNMESVDLLVTTGSQDGICKAMEAMVSPGDKVLVETPVYSGTLAILKPMDCDLLPVRSDSNGLDPSDLEKTMSKWNLSDVKDKNSDIPKLLYIIPNGGNPTGHGLTLNRKKAIYEIARKYDLLILEDDPYYYLQFNEPYVPSMLSMDVDGRVVRFDSFSKLISSGMRLGTVTGPKIILERISLHMQASVMHASSLSQMLLLQVLSHWGYDGFDHHVREVTHFYKEKKDQCIRAAEKHLKGLAEWSEPSGGMFLWLKLAVPDTYPMITVKARSREVLFVPGNAFQLDDRRPSQYVRASYSTCTEEDMNTAFKRLAGLIQEEQQSAR